MKTSQLLRLGLVLLPGATFAADPDPDLPQPFDPSTLAPVITSSPFTRMVNMSDNLVLTGIAYIDGKPVATIFNRETKQSHVVSEQPNIQGWKLNEAQPAPDVTRSQAKITIGGEVVSVRYAPITAQDMKGDPKRDGDRGSSSSSSSSGSYNRGSRGPSEEDRKRYEALSESGKEKLRSFFREKFSDEKFRNAPEEERRNMIRAQVEKIEREDKGGSGGGKRDGGR